MKILMLISQFPPAACGGAELQCWRQARALAARGHAVKVLTRWQAEGTPRWETKEGVRIGRLGFYLPWMARKRQILRVFRRKGSLPAPGEDKHGGGHGEKPFSISSRKRRWPVLAAWLTNVSFMLDVSGLFVLRRLQADVIHVHMAGWLAGFGHWLAERMGVPVFCKESNQPAFHNTDTEHVPWKAQWMKRMLKCRFIAITDRIAEEIADSGISPSRIVKVPNGVEIPGEAADPRGHADALYAGNFTKGAGFKGFDILLQAWGKATREEPGMRLRLYGRGNARPWEQYAVEQNCGSSVLFEGTTDDIWAAHRQSGFLVLPSRREGLSNALLEAMASGLPAVVSDLPGNRAAVRDGVDGRVVPVGDADALAAAMLEMGRNPEIRARMGRAARQRAEEEFSMDRVAEQLEKAYIQARSSNPHK